MCDNVYRQNQTQKEGLSIADIIQLDKSCFHSQTGKMLPTFWESVNIRFLASCYEIYFK